MDATLHTTLSDVLDPVLSGTSIQSAITDHNHTVDQIESMDHVQPQSLDPPQNLDDLEHLTSPSATSLKLHSSGQIQPSQGSPQPPPPLADDVPTEIPPSTPVRGKRGRKPRTSTPSVMVDDKRREANRLAAERSRGRQQEKVVALEMAVQALGEENIKLKEEIARLEGRGDDPSNVIVDPAMMDSAAAAVAAVIDNANGSNAPHSLDSQTQVETQSRNILAALLSQPGVPLDEALAAGLAATDDAEAANWMQGVESLFKDADPTGRLGELAAVAAGQGEGSSSSVNGLHTPDLSGPSDKTASGSKPAFPLAIPGLLPAASAAAVAINAEMEKTLRDELAETRVSIARVESELARVRRLPSLETEEPTTPLPPSTLPSGLFDEGMDADRLRSWMEQVNAEVEQLNSEKLVLREVVSRMADSNAEEGEKVKELADEIRALGMDGGEQERDKVSVVLKALRATITNLMIAPAGDLAGNALVTPFSSPATARRKRGRPPKSSTAFSASKPYVFPLSYHTPSPSGRSDSKDASSGSPNTPTAPRTRASARGRSRLAYELLSEEPAPEAGPSSKGDLPESVTPIQQDAPPSATQGANQGEPAQSSVLETEPRASVIPETNSQTVEEVQDLVAQALPNPHADAHNDYLMSHLTDLPDTSRPIPLDSSSFAAFLPEPPHHSPNIDPTTLGSAASPVPDTQEQAAESTTQDPPPNVLSRLKRGPPGSCDICGRTETTVWRKLVLAGEDHKVCNPCGLYHAKFGVIRPPELWGDGKSVKKRRTSSRPTTTNYDGSPNGNKRKRKSKFGFEEQQPHEAEMVQGSELHTHRPDPEPNHHDSSVRSNSLPAPTAADINSNGVNDGPVGGEGEPAEPQDLTDVDVGMFEVV